MQKRERNDVEQATGRPKRAAAAAAAAAIAAGAGPAQTRQKKASASPPQVKEEPAAQELQESAGEQQQQGRAQQPVEAQQARVPQQPLQQPEESSQQQQQPAQQQQQPQQSAQLQQPEQQQSAQPAATLPALVTPWVSPHRQASAPTPEWGYQHLLPVAELQLRMAQRRRQCCQQLVTQLSQTAQEVALQLTLLQAAGAQAVARAAAGLPIVPPGGPAAVQARGSSAAGSAAGGKPRAAGGGGSKHDASTCRVRNCLRCAAAARAQASMTGSEVTGAAAGGLPTPGVTPSGTPRVGQRRRRQDSEPARQQAMAVQAAPSASSGGPGPGLPLAASPPAMSAAALMLWESHQQLDTLVCAAICEAVPALPAVQEAVAVWCEQSGCQTVAEVATALESSQQVWNMAMAASKDAGAKLLHWAAFLQACKRAAGMGT